jgi:hypothetical protein
MRRGAPPASRIAPLACSIAKDFPHSSVRYGAIENSGTQAVCRAKSLATSLVLLGTFIALRRYSKPTCIAYG